MIAPGAIVTCRQTSATLWVVRHRSTDGGWHLIGKVTNGLGHMVHTGRSAGEGDLHLIREAETYEVVSTVERDGQTLTVVADLGGSVEFAVPEISRPLCGGDAQSPAAGNTTTIYKADLTLENLR
jgi:hypothetical protein